MSVSIFTTISEFRGAMASRGQTPVGLVPTMGALHAGHARLIETARGHGGTVVVSIFVNPLQFDQESDYKQYARTLDADAALCARHGADIIFAPSTAELYPRPQQTFVDVEGLTEHFCGRSRPGHFRGVATVVAKLFHIAAPQLAFFGEKDAQQLAVIERMTADLDLPVHVIAVPTVRELDGLALSSRNSRLSPSERTIAPCLYRALCEARDRIGNGERNVSAILRQCRRHLERPGVRIDYFDLADLATMTPATAISCPVRAMGAIWIGATRLIDNMVCRPS